MNATHVHRDSRIDDAVFAAELRYMDDPGARCARASLRSLRACVPRASRRVILLLAGRRRQTANRQRFRARDAARERFAFADARLADFALPAARSGKRLDPVSRFHSSNVSFEILPSTSNCANFRRCAWLLNGMPPPIGRSPGASGPGEYDISGSWRSSNRSRDRRCARGRRYRQARACARCNGCAFTLSSPTAGQHSPQPPA